MRPPRLCGAPLDITSYRRGVGVTPQHLDDQTRLEQQTHALKSLNVVPGDELEVPDVELSKWGDPISKERQAQLKELANEQREWLAQPRAERGLSPYMA